MQVLLLSPCKSLWIRNLKNCEVFSLPVGGSIYVTACDTCVLYLGSRQLRMHTSKHVDFYIHTSSHPIIEHCERLRFAPYPTAQLPPKLVSSAFGEAGLNPEANQWELVDDFDWLKATASPNWSVLPAEERAAPKCMAQLRE